MEELIFDRTQEDVTNKTDKGYHDINDLNRVEEWCRYIASLLNLYNYQVKITTKTNWQYTDARTVAQMERIRSNIALLRSTYKNIPRDVIVPSSLSPIDVDKANNIEKILYEIDKTISEMEHYFIHSGVGRSGQSWNIQNYFRRE